MNVEIKVEPAIKKRSTDVEAVFIADGGLTDVANSLDAFIINTPAEIALLLIDNGCIGTTRRFLEDAAATLPNSVLQRRQFPRSYSELIGRVLKQSSSNYVAVVTSRAVVGRDWLGKLMACARARKAWVVSPLSNEIINAVSSREPGERSFGKAVSFDIEPLYPEVPAATSSCLLIDRRAVLKIGSLDKAMTSAKACVEDLAVRALARNTTFSIADDCFIEGSATTGALPTEEVGGQSSARKHSADLLELLDNEVRGSEPLLRACVRAQLVGSTPPVPGRRDLGGLKIAWLQPHMKVAGGIRRTVEMTNRMRHWGSDVTFVSPSGLPPTWITSEVRHMTFDEAKLSRFDLVVHSDPDVIEMADEIKAGRRANYHLGAYMLYRRESNMLRQYYNKFPSAIQIANSTFTADQVRTYAPHISIAGIVPGGVNRAHFHPARIDPESDIGFVGSLARRHKGVATILAATVGLRRMPISSINSSQGELASRICRNRVFVSGAWHEGFNLIALESMACGVPVLMTDDGGSRDYARHGENALVVPVRDVDAMRKATFRLLTDGDLRRHLIASGLKTAWKYDWDDVTEQFLSLVLDGL